MKEENHEEDYEVKDIRYEVIRLTADALYDHQEVRISSANRVRALIRRKLLGLGFKKESKKKVDADEEPKWSDEELLKKMQEAQDKGLLSETGGAMLVDAFNLAMSESKIEMEYEKKLNPLIMSEPIMEWLSHVKGIGPRNTARLLKFFGYCEKADTVSQLWSYAGLGLKDNKIVKRTKGEQLPYNLKIKTACVGVIAKSLIMAGGVYKTQVYDTYKRRILERGCCENPYKGSIPARKGHMCKEFPGHAERMSIRYMTKIFLAHYWMKCRAIKNLPMRDPYPIEKQGHTTIIEPLVDC